MFLCLTKNSVLLDALDSDKLEKDASEMVNCADGQAVLNMEVDDLGSENDSDEEMLNFGGEDSGSDESDEECNKEAVFDEDDFDSDDETDYSNTSDMETNVKKVKLKVPYFTFIIYMRRFLFVKIRYYLC